MRKSSLAYSLVQISPDSVRGERVNVGVLVFDLETGAVVHRFSEDFSRVSKLGYKRSDSFLKFALDELKARVESEFSRPVDRQSLRRFINSRANNIRLSDLEPAFGPDAPTEAERLFEKLVGTRERQKRDTRVTVKLRSGLQKLGILNRFDNKPEPVSLPRYDIKLRPDFGIKRERYHLIEAARFDDRESALKAAGFHVLAGRAIHDTLNMKLVVVGDFGDQPSDFVENIRDDLARAKTALYDMNALGDMAQDYTFH